MNGPMTCIRFALTALAFAVSGCVSAGDGGESAVAAAGNRRLASGAEARSVLPGVTYGATPGNLEWLDGAGTWALFAGETAEDSAVVAAEVSRDPETPLWQNSLFLRCLGTDGKPEWRLVLASGMAWRPEDMADWLEKEFRERFFVLHARFSSDRRHIYLVLDPHTYTWFAVCIYDMCTNVALPVRWGRNRGMSRRHPPHQECEKLLLRRKRRPLRSVLVRQMYCAECFK